jgi:D-serine deaminase-like pyridoxal phosphate-dependent protein
MFNKNIKIHTPSLIIKKKCLLKNIKTMSKYSLINNINIRPHAKSHKMSTIAKIQIKHGAIGVCVATLYEAEIMIKNKIKGVLLTTPITNNYDKERLKKLIKLSKSFMMIIDNPISIKYLENISRENINKINVLVDCDIMRIGTNKISRTGARTIKEIVTIAGLINKHTNLNYIGITAYAGDVQHINNYNKRKIETTTRHNYLNKIINSLKKENLSPKIISGGGTGSHDIDTKSKLYTELQPGSYIYSDAEYDNVSIYKSKSNPYKAGLFVATSIISIIDKNNYIVDAGLKALSTDSKLLPIPVGNLPLGSKYSFMGDEHGKITIPKNSQILLLGETVYIQPTHCDPTVNLYDHCKIIINNKIKDSWKIDARGYG